MPPSLRIFIQKKRTWLPTLSLLFWSCVGTPPSVEPPIVPAPLTWESSGSSEEEGNRTPVTTLRFPGSEFVDTAVPSLVGEALAQSPFLESAEALAEAAGAQFATARSARRPQVNARLQGTRQKHNLGTSAAFGRYFGGSTFVTNHYASNLAASWEIDLWGRLRNLENAARADHEAALLDFQVARLSIAAQTARGWTALTAASLADALASETVKSYEANLGVIQTRFQQGLASALDLRLTQASLTSARANLEKQSRLEKEARRALEILLARYPSAKIHPGKSLPQLQSLLLVGLPAQLLTRRPDIKAAQQRLRAAGLRAREAEKGFLPNLSLTGSTGTASQELRNLTDSNFSAWNLFGNLAQPLLDGGRIQARKHHAAALQKKAVAQYRSVLLQAFREVEDALDAEARLAREEAALSQAAAEFAEAETLAWERYSKGLTDILTPLEAQRRSNEAGIRHLALQAQRIDNRIQLHLALASELGMEE